MNVFGPNGGVQMSGFSSAAMRIAKGKEHIGYFRCGVKGKGNKGSELDPADPAQVVWTKKTLNNAATMYSKCCGTWICFHGPGNLLETNSLGVVGWQRVERKGGADAQPVVFTTKFADRTGVPVPKGIQAGKAIQMSCGSMCKFVCIGICCDNYCKCCGPCHAALCCRCIKEPLLKQPPVSAEMYRGVAVEYVGDDPGATEKYLYKGTWGGRPAEA